MHKKGVKITSNDASFRYCATRGLRLPQCWLAGGAQPLTFQSTTAS